MRYSALIFLFIFLSIHTQAADTYQVGDSLYVWAPSGLNIRTTPGTHGSKLGKLEPGERITVVELTDREISLLAVDARPGQFETIHSSPGSEYPFYLEGKWVKVKTATFTGFVVDMYLLKIPPPEKPIAYQAYFEELTGEKMKIERSQGKCEGDSDCSSLEGKTEAGYNIWESSDIYGDGHGVFIPNMTFEEGFIFANFVDALEDGLRTKKKKTLLLFQDKDEEAISFMVDFICQIGMNEEDSGVSIYWDCSY